MTEQTKPDEIERAAKEHAERKWPLDEVPTRRDFGLGALRVLSRDDFIAGAKHERERILAALKEKYVEGAMPDVESIIRGGK